MGGEFVLCPRKKKEKSSPMLSPFWHFFENWKHSGLTPGQNDDPVTRT